LDPLKLVVALLVVLNAKALVVKASVVEGPVACTTVGVVSLVALVVA